MYVCMHIYIYIYMCESWIFQQATVDDWRVPTKMNTCWIWVGAKMRYS